MVHAGFGKVRGARPVTRRPSGRSIGLVEPVFSFSDGTWLLSIDARAGSSRILWRRGYTSWYGTARGTAVSGSAAAAADVPRAWFREAAPALRPLGVCGWAAEDVQPAHKAAHARLAPRVKPAVVTTPQHIDSCAQDRCGRGIHLPGHASTHPFKVPIPLPPLPVVPARRRRAHHPPPHLRDDHPPLHSARRSPVEHGALH